MKRLIDLKSWSWKQILLVAVAIVCVAGIGCESVMDEITPCIVDARSREYVGESSVRTVTTLAEAKEMRTEIGIRHRDNLLDLRRSIENDENAYMDAILIDARIVQSQEWQDMMIGSEGNPLSIAGILAGTSIGGLIGARMKRKGDLSPEETEVKVRDAVEKERNSNGTGSSKPATA